MHVHMVIRLCLPAIAVQEPVVLIGQPLEGRPQKLSASQKHSTVNTAVRNVDRDEPVQTSSKGCSTVSM